MQKIVQWLIAPWGRRLNRSWRIRRLVQAAFLLICIGMGVQFTLFIRAARNGTAPLPVRPPGIEGFLPISGLMGLRDWWLQGSLNQVHPSATMLVLTFGLMAILLRKAFCGWICPVGTLSESLAWLGRKLYGRNFRMNRWVDIPLRGLKWLLLGFFLQAIVRMSATELRGFLESNYNRVADIKMGMFFVELGQVGVLVLLLLIVGSTFINGFWCRYLCPYGAFLGFLGRFSPTRVQRDPVSCIDCGKCDQICMAQLPVSKSRNVFSVECTGCMDCTAACPVEDALVMRAGKRPLPVWGFALAVILIFVGGYVGSRGAGLWHNSISDQEYIQRVNTMDGPGYGHPGMGGSH